MIGTISIGNLSIFVQFVVLVTKVQMCRETAYFSTTTTAKRRTIFQKIWKNHMIVRNRERNNDCRLHIFSHLSWSSSVERDHFYLLHSRGRQPWTFEPLTRCGNFISLIIGISSLESNPTNGWDACQEREKTTRSMGCQCPTKLHFKIDKKWIIIWIDPVTIKRLRQMENVTRKSLVPPIYTVRKSMTSAPSSKRKNGLRCHNHSFSSSLLFLWKNMKCIVIKFYTTINLYFHYEFKMWAIF